MRESVIHMLRSWRLATTLLLAAAATAQVPAAVVPTADVHRVLSAPDFDQAAFAAILRAGDGAVPALLTALAEPSAFAEPLSVSTTRALRALRLLGPAQASGAVRPLLAAITRDGTRDDRELLETLAVLASGVPDRQALSKETASIEIASPQPAAPGGMDRFLRWVAKMRGWYRFRQRLAEDIAADVPNLTTQLEHEDPLLRERAAQLLGTLGENARTALPALQHAAATKTHPRATRCDIGSLTADFHELVRDAAAMAIARIDPRADGATRGLVLLLERADAPQERQLAAQALACVPAAQQQEAVGPLLAATASDDARVAGEAITALGQLGCADAPVLARLQVLAAAPAAGLAARARAALRVLQPAK